MFKSCVLIMLTLFAGAASAHTGPHDLGGFISGFSHPLLGIDHLLFMFGVGLWASRLSLTQALITLLSFLSFMLIGTGLARQGLVIPGLETGILGSVMVVSFLLASSRPISTLLIAVLLVDFALFHGFAHGLELPLSTEPSHYVLGFTLSTALLQSIGLLIGYAINKQATILRLWAYVTGGLGLYLLFAS